jgi:hypothetical protein
MWIKLLRPHAVFYPPRVEPAGSIVSVGGPKGAGLVAAGIAEPAAQPPDIDDARVPELRDSDDAQLTKTEPRDIAKFAPRDPRPEMPPLSAEANALVAALSRRARRRRKNV